MTTWLRQSTAKTVKLGPFVDPADGVSAVTTLTIAQADIRISKDGGAFAQSGNTAGGTHNEAGWYDIPLDATDTNTLGSLMLSCFKTGAMRVWREFIVLPAVVYDAMVAGTDKLQVHADEITAGLLTSAAFAANALNAAALAQDAAEEIAAATWNVQTSSHQTAGSTGKALTDASSAGDPWATALPGSYAAGSAGEILAGRLATSGYTAPDNAGITAIKAKTDNLPADPADQSEVAALINALNNLSSAQVTAAVMDDVIEGTFTMRQIMRILSAAMAGKVSGAGTNSVTFRGIGDTKDRIVATVTELGDRSALTLDAT